MGGGLDQFSGREKWEHCFGTGVHTSGLSKTRGKNFLLPGGFANVKGEQSPWGKRGKNTGGE